MRIVQTPLEGKHFFVSSVGSWTTGPVLEELLASIRHDRLPFHAYLVHLPQEAPYTISNYRPDLPDDQLTYLGFWDVQLQTSRRNT